MILNQFAGIERKIETLIDQYTAVLADNTRLKEQILALENELSDKLAVEARIAEEKAVIRNIIDRLLSRLESVSEE